jgi:hypothetical protein
MTDEQRKPTEVRGEPARKKKENANPPIGYCRG